MNVPPSLQNPDLLPLWETLRDRLDRFGSDRRGIVQRPALSPAAALALESLLGRSLTARLDLEKLEAALVKQGVGENLDQALQALGAPPSTERAESRVALDSRIRVRDEVNRTVATWGEHWATEWKEWIFRSGQFAGDDIGLAVDTVHTVRRLLDAISSVEHGSIARNDLAANVSGSSHALDDGVLLERCVRRALWYQYGQELPASSGREIWELAGVITDRVSAPVLCWRLPLDPVSVLGTITSGADVAGLPIHLTQLALRNHPLIFNSKNPVLLVENPRIVEAAAERDVPWCVVATNGNPSTAVTLLVDSLLTQGIEVRHHGDFDSAGIGICRRLLTLGCKPWLMGEKDYISAVEYARQLPVVLPQDTNRCGDTAWDPGLQRRFDELHAIVHEELLIDVILHTEAWQHPITDS